MSRTDFEYRATCPEHGDDHIELEASATNRPESPTELFPLENCPGCGRELDISIDDRPTEVLD